MPITINGTGPIDGITSLNTTVSNTELGYLDGTTSAIQTQLGSKADILSNGAWTSYTPTWTNFTVGNATQEWYYTQIGKTIMVRGVTTLGSTSSMGSSPTMTFPVNARTAGNIANITSLGNAVLRVTGTSWIGDVYYQSTTQVGFYRINVNGSQISHNTVTSTTPATWASGDSIIARFSYEAA